MRIIKNIHYILGILLGIPLMLSGITGAIYAWQPEITKVCYPDLYAVDYPDAEISAEALVAKVTANSNRHIKRLYFPERERNSYCIQYFNDNSFYFYHPVSGDELGQLDYRKGWLDTILKIHTFSYLKFGRKFIAWASLILALGLITTGLWLWKPKKRSFKSSDFTLQKHQWKSPTIFYKGHKILGLYTSIVLFLIALTGAFFVFKSEVKMVLGSITGVPASKPHQIDTPASNDLLTINEALEIARNNFKSYPIRSIILTDKYNSRGYISWMKEKGLSTGKRDRPYVYINPVSRELTYIYTPSTANITDAIVNAWIPQIHLGELGGYFTRLINFIASLVLVFLCISGFYMVYKRKLG